MSLLNVKYPIVVEGKYDKIKLSSLVNAEIIQTDGFRIFSKKETRVQGLMFLAENLNNTAKCEHRI